MNIAVRAALAATLGSALLAAPAYGQTIKPEADVNGDGELDSTEFAKGMTAIDLAQYDVDGDGSVTTVEYAQSNGRTAKRTAGLVKRFDANKDGVLEADEFEALNRYIFSLRDKDKNGKLSFDEIPGQLKNR